MFAVFLLAPCGPAFPQDYSDPLWNYRAGRDMENLNRIDEAGDYYSQAERLCNDLISRNTAGRDTYTILTWALRRQGKHGDVIIWGERGLRLYADEYRIVETMGEAYFYLEDYDMSLRFMQRYTNAAPEDGRVPVAYFFAGEIYRLRKQYRHADIAYTAAVTLGPGSALWWYRLGSVREAAGEYLQAVDAYEQAVQLDSGYEEAVDALARSRGLAR